MKKEKFLLISAIVLFILNLATLGVIFFGMHHGRDVGMHPPGAPPPDGPKDFIIDKLGFNDDQKKQFEELKKDHHKKADSLMETSRKMHDDFFALLKTDPVNRSAVDSLSNMLSANQKQLDKLTFEHFEKLKAICNDEQKKKFNGIIEELSH